MLSNYIDSTIATLERLRALEPEAQKAIELLAECFGGGGKIFACGNGGSAAEAAHFATEFLCRFEKDRPSLPALNLTADGSFLTATGNDYEFHHIFARQIEGLGKKGDVLVVFTTSGNSRNVVEALKAAHTRGLKTIALLGRDGGECRDLADIALIVPAEKTANIQEAHQVLLHHLCGQVEQIIFPNLKR